MSKEGNPKLRLLNLMMLLYAKTDEAHPMKIQNILKELQSAETPTSRGTLTADIEVLRTFGMNIEKDKYAYCCIERPLEPYEVNVIIDAILSSKLVTEEQTERLVKKIERVFLSKFQADTINRRIKWQGRLKSRNSVAFQNTLIIHDAIDKDRAIRFRYFAWGVKHGQKEYHIRGGSDLLVVSPFFTLFDNENYYLVGYAHYANGTRHYRVDKMENVVELQEERQGKQLLNKISIADYTKRIFNMFDGEVQKVKLLCENAMSNVMVDHFGHDIIMIPKDNTHFSVNIDVNISNQFYGFIFGLKQQVRIIGPDHVVKGYKEYLDQEYALYRDGNS